jgi:hypothetical protein
MLGARMTPSVQAESLAHSGAIIGVGHPDGPPPPGEEIPSDNPTILNQVANYAGDTQSVDLLLINGGINDVNIRNIFDPLADEQNLIARTQLHCYSDMKILLGQARTKFSNATIVVVGYFPVLSSYSERALIPKFLGFHGISLLHPLTGELYLPFIDKIIQSSITFWHTSDDSISQAVQEMNQGDGRILFVSPGFTEQNSTFVPGTSFLWGLTPDLEPEDNVVAERHQECLQFYGSDPLQILNCEVCFRASAGHPNVTGAQAIADRIANLLGIS